MKRLLFLTFILTVLISTESISQDSSKTTPTPLKYQSIGFQVSFVSAIGISYGINEENNYRALFTGGLLTDNGKTYFAFGVDYQKDLTQNQSFRVFIGPSAGTRGVTFEKPTPRIALGTGLEFPLSEKRIYQNITAGVTVYYPTFFFLSKNIAFAGGMFLLYNF